MSMCIKYCGLKVDKQFIARKKKWHEMHFMIISNEFSGREKCYKVLFRKMDKVCFFSIMILDILEVATNKQCNKKSCVQKWSIYLFFFFLFVRASKLLTTMSILDDIISDNSWAGWNSNVFLLYLHKFSGDFFSELLNNILSFCIEPLWRWVDIFSNECKSNVLVAQFWE